MQVLALVVGLVCGLCYAQNLPSSGLYVSFSDVALSSTAELVTTDIVNDINSYTGWQTISGSSSSASYTFSNWKVAIAAVTPQWKDAGTNELMVGWQEFNFTIESNYHVCATAWPNPCEDGNLYVYTTDIYTKLFLDTTLDLTQSPPFVNVTATDLDFRQNGIEVYVQCTNTFCLIPVQDIANAVAENFVSLFQNAVAKSARTAFEKNIAKYQTEFSFADGLGLDMESNWWFLPGSYGANPIMIVPETGGFYTNVSGNVVQPPFSPSFTPSSDFLDNPEQDLNIAVTEYFFDSLTWALGALGFFNKVITSSEVPAESPVQLNTKDAFFLQVVPGLSAYPNMDITVTTKYVEIGNTTIDTAGVHINALNITLDFALSNTSYSTHGWTLSNSFYIDLNMVAAASGNLVMFNATIANFSSDVIVTETDVGSITGAGFSTLYQLLETQIKLPGFALHLPDTVSASNPSIQLYTQFFGFAVDFGVSDVPEETFQDLHKKPHIPISIVH